MTTIVGMPRRIMHPFTFSDGTQVPAGNWIVVPQQAHMKDGTHYADPENFNGFRFVKDMQGASGSSESRLSHPSWLFPFWGSVKQAWYGPASFQYSFFKTDFRKPSEILRHGYDQADLNRIAHDL
jgi:hypothetical protein